jgi:hypothetical protein
VTVPTQQSGQLGRGITSIPLLPEASIVPGNGWVLLALARI